MPTNKSTGSPLGANDGGGDLSQHSSSRAAKGLGGRKRSPAGGKAEPRKSASKSPTGKGRRGGGGRKR